MSELQTSHPGSELSPAALPSATCQGFHQSPGEVAWHRKDWGQSPVGYFSSVSVTNRVSVVRDLKLKWAAVRIERLRLAQRASLLLLQGQALSSILIPNHYIVVEDQVIGERHEHQLGHVLLRVDPWRYWLPVPELTGLLIAKLGEIPDGISSSEALAALIQDSAA